jgi:dihydrofolate synthase / folylpolyglutamate synthase
MNYQETVNWMFEQLPMYQNIGKSAYKADLTNTILLSDYLGNPEKKLKCIHVAGTNGKGSTSHMLASILQEAGYKVGLYTSPHLKDYRERIKINGPKASGEISEDFVIDFIKKNKVFFEQNSLSFFEMTVGLALDYFVNQKIDIAIIEVGLGGRLDSTNIISPLVSVITNIGLDHTQFLGNTLELIAKEKAGIIKHKIPVVIGEYNNQTKSVFIDKAFEENAEIYFASDTIQENYPSDLAGDYQVANKKTVLQTIRILQFQRFFTINEENIKNGFLNVIKNTGLQGRWQILQEKPMVICDTAHNKHGLEIVLKQLQKQKFDQLHFVFGVVNDKDLDSILPLFPKNAIYYFCKPNIFRGLDAKILQQESKKYALNGEVYISVTNAYKSALQNSSPNDLIYIGGSTFVVAEIL